MKINIKGLEKAKVLKALYDASHVQGIRFSQTKENFTLEDAQNVINNTPSMYFDYVYGVVLKVNLSGDEFDSWLFDRDNYEGAAKDAINKLIKQEGVNIKIISTISNNKENYDNSNDQYEELLDSMLNKFNLINTSSITLFKTNVKDLYDTFLENLPEEAKQHYNCNTCRSFVNKYGSLVYIDTDFIHKSAIFDYTSTPEFFKPAVEALIRKVEKADIMLAYYTTDNMLGTPVTGEWKHMHVCNSNICNHSKTFINTYLKCQTREMINISIDNFKMVKYATECYDLDIANKALTLLTTNSLCRADKFTKMGEAVAELFKTLNGEKNERKRNNIIWRYVADNIKTSYCHIKSGMLGTLYDDIKEGYDFDTIAKRFADKVDPLNYMRPKAAPSAGNIKRAEELIHELGLEKSLERRFANIDELTYLWKPEKPEDNNKPKEGGIFSHLLDKETIKRDSEKLNLQLPITRMSWVKFRRDILPKVKSMKIKVPMTCRYFTCFTTAFYEDAKPILKYDKEDNRNPISSYMYSLTTSASDWNLDGGRYYDVYGITTRADEYGKSINEIKNVIFTIKGMKDLRCVNKNVGNALFPELLIPELHEIRSTIEAYSKSAKLHDYDKYSACGIRFTNNQYIELKVDLGNGIVSNYIIDRFE